MARVPKSRRRTAFACYNERASSCRRTCFFLIPALVSDTHFSLATYLRLLLALTSSFYKSSSGSTKTMNLLLLLISTLTSSLYFTCRLTMEIYYLLMMVHVDSMLMVSLMPDIQYGNAKACSQSTIPVTPQYREATYRTCVSFNN
jgi:hypothetical protein